MTQITPHRMTATIDGDFVVFLIGMRINKPWKVHKWLPVFLAMPRMLKELGQRPESGFLGCTMGFPAIVQHWRSFEQLGGLRTQQGPRALAGMGGVQQACRREPRRCRDLARNLPCRRRTEEMILACLPSLGPGKIGQISPHWGLREWARWDRAAATS